MADDQLISKDAIYTEYQGWRLILGPGFTTGEGIMSFSDASSGDQQGASSSRERGADGSSNDLVGAGASRSSGHDGASADNDGDARGPEWTDS